MKYFSLIVIFCFLFVIGCESTQEVYNPSPTFMSGDRKMVGIEGNLAIFSLDNGLDRSIFIEVQIIDAYVS